MPYDINDSLEQEEKRSSHLVYKEGVKVVYQNADKKIHAAILPAFAETDQKDSYLPCRHPEDPDRFTPWACSMIYHPFVNREQSIISPNTFDKDAFDPIKELIKVIKSDPEHAIIAGYGEDGKKVQGAYKMPEVRLQNPSRVWCVNSLILFDKDIPSDEARILQIPNTAFSSQQKDRSGGSASKSWGLLSEIRRKNRKATEGDSIEDQYFWGDITDPRNLIPCVLTLEKGPAGGIPIYNMFPIDDEDPIQINRKILSTRYNLDDIFYPVEELEIIERLAYFFSDIPRLLKRAFAHRIPNFDRFISRSTATTVTGSGEEEDDELDMSPAPRSRRREIDAEEGKGPSRLEEAEKEVSAEKQRNFAPEEDEDDLPPPGGIQPKAAASAKEDEGEDEEVVVKPTRRAKVEQQDEADEVDEKVEKVKSRAKSLKELI